MALEPALQSRIESVIKSNRVVLFMKGTPQQPQCGFSAATIGILDGLIEDYSTVNVLEDQGIREGIKEFSDWPTIPQLYVDQEFVGGCDLVREMFNAGELHEALGLPAPDRTPPEITLSDEAREVIEGATEGQPGVSVHLAIDAQWNHNFNLGPASGDEIRTTSNGIEILMDLATAQRARGLMISVSESFQGKSLNIENPNMPPPVAQMEVSELKAKLDAGEPLHLFDVREPHERETASIAGSVLLDSETVQTIEAMDKDALLVFHCHHGQRSQQAADHFRMQGFTNVHNVVGGIDAWSREIDTSVPRY